MESWLPRPPSPNKSTCHVRRLGKLVGAVAARPPAVARIRAMLPRVDGDVVRNHEDRVEADAELADDVGRRGGGAVAGRVGQLLHEPLGARRGDCACGCARRVLALAADGAAMRRMRALPASAPAQLLTQPRQRHQSFQTRDGVGGGGGAVCACVRARVCGGGHNMGSRVLDAAPRGRKRPTLWHLVGCAQVRNEVVPRHPDARVGDGERPSLAVSGDRDCHLTSALLGRSRHLGVPPLLQCVRRLLDEWRTLEVGARHAALRARAGFTFETISRRKTSLSV